MDLSTHRTATIGRAKAAGRSETDRNKVSDHKLSPNLTIHSRRPRPVRPGPGARAAQKAFPIANDPASIDSTEGKKDIRMTDTRYMVNSNVMLLLNYSRG